MDLKQVEIIKKNISLDSLISHHCSLIPYVGNKTDDEGKYILSPNGNWGKVSYDIDINLCKGYESLKEYFNDGNGRVPFNELHEKWLYMNNILKNTTFYKKITKNNKKKWKVNNPLLQQKLTIDIYDESVINIEDAEEDLPLIIGVYKNNQYNENGGSLMMEFLCKAMGFFIIDSKFIKVDNYVPEMLYYCGIEDYCNQLDTMKNSKECCQINEYVRYGGDDFYAYLNSKINERKKEFNYWVNALYREEGTPLSPNINLPVLLCGGCKNIGNYDVLEADGVIDINAYENNELKRKVVTTSPLLKLKRPKKSYLFNTETNENEEIDVILDENLKNEEGYFLIMTPKYVKGVGFNLYEDNGKTYGDVIFKIEKIEDSNVMEISYVLGGELYLTPNDEKDGKYGFLDTYSYDEKSHTGVVYKERVVYDIFDYTKENYQLKQIYFDEEINILNTFNVKYSNEAEIIYDSRNNEVEGIFYMRKSPDMGQHNIIMNDYNFGKINTLIENINEIIIDRGYASAFELHYRMGEINSFEDMANYQNNVFGL